MPLPADLRSLAVDLPACPRVLLEMMSLLNDDTTPLSMIASLVEEDMALASAVVRTVNSAMFGLLRRVETVGEAVRYLGTREVAAITLETALRASFPPTPRMRRLWQDASQAGVLMGRSAHALAIDPLQAHTAGLFARGGQAVLLARLGSSYEALLDAFEHDPAALCTAEVAAFGIDHGAYGSALCASWGLAPNVIHYVRDRVRPPSQWVRHDRSLRRMLALGAVTDALLREGDHESLATGVDTTTDGETADLIAAVRPAWTRLQAA
jgi:HD-like signal output (HDOD) protein